MKKIITLFIGIVSATNVMATDSPISCPTVTLSGTLSNRTLDKDTTYLLSGCVSVPSGVTIIAEAGVVIMGEKSSNGTLVFRKGSTFTSQGTSSLPVIFTSNQVQANRKPGDWGGIVFEGSAPNNNSNSITLTNRTCESVNGGGTTSADNSGTLKFMRIELATYGLTAISMGSGTEMHDIEIARCSQNGLELYGGTVNFKRMVLLDNFGYDILATQGNQSKAQGIVAVRLDNNAHLSSTDVSSIVFKNNDNAPSYAGSMGSTNTHPIFSNVTLIGPKYCVASPDPEFKNGILMLNNTEGGIYNTYIDGWPTGYRIEGSATIQNANNNGKILFNATSFYNNPTNFFSSTTWSSGCEANISDWLTLASTSCDQTGNETGTSIGYSSVCSYTSTAPDFTLSSSSILSPDFTSYDELTDNSSFFASTSLRGAFDDEDWTAGWANWAIASEDFCPQSKGMVATGINNVANDKNNLAVAPNPADGITYATFTTAQSGSVQLTVTNSIGQVVRTIKQDLGKGDQRVAIPVTGLSSGMYIVNVTTDKENIVHRRLVVK